MKALIWKEVREVCVPFGVFLAVVLAATIWPKDSNALDRPSLITVTILGLVFLSPLFAIWWGANVLARDRGAGTLEFLGSLPVTATRVWAVKAGVALVGLVVIEGMLVLLASAVVTSAPGGDSQLAYGTYVWVLCALGLLLFSLGLVISGTRRNPFEALLVTILALLLIGVGWFLLADLLLAPLWGPYLGITATGTSFTTLASLALVLSVVCLAASAVGWIPTLPLAHRARLWRTSGWAAALVVVALPILLLGVWHFGQPEPRDLRQLVTASISPNGQWISLQDDTYDDFAGGFARRLWLMRSDGTSLRCVSRGPMAERDWSADGTGLSIYYLVRGDVGRRWRVDVPSGRISALYGRHPSATSSSRMAPLTGEPPYIWRPERDHYVVVKHGTNEPVTQVSGSTLGKHWTKIDFALGSPDGRRVAFLAGIQGPGETPGTFELLTAHDNGSDLRVLAQASARSNGPGAFAIGGWTRGNQLLVILYASNRLVKIDPDTARQTLILQGFGPGWD